MISELSSQAERSLFRIEPGYVHDWWPEASVLLEALIEDSHGRHTMEAVFEALERAHMQLWVMLDGDDNLRGVLISELLRHHGGLKVMVLRMAAGEGMDALEFLPQLEEEARRMGCGEVEIFGRRGWEKVCKDYEFRGVSLCKRI